MSDLRGRYLDMRSEKGAVPRLALILEVKNDSEKQAPIMLARGSVYTFSAPVHGYDIGHFLGEAVISDGWSGPSSIAGKEAKKWWARVEIGKEVVKFVERARQKGDLYLNVVLETLVLEVRDGRPSSRWVALKDYEDNSKNYVHVKIARSDWENCEFGGRVNSGVGSWILYFGLGEENRVGRLFLGLTPRTSSCRAAVPRG